MFRINYKSFINLCQIFILNLIIVTSHATYTILIPSAYKYCSDY